MLASFPGLSLVAGDGIGVHYNTRLTYVFLTLLWRQDSERKTHGVQGG